MSRRTKITASYSVGSVKIDVEKLQLELDATFENNGRVTVIEAKNGFVSDFSIYQIFLPLLDYHQKNIDGVDRIESCYIAKDKRRSLIRFYLYSFPNPKDMSSIKLVKKTEYNLQSVKT